jgi:predicted CoA-binding protein
MSIESEIIGSCRVIAVVGLSPNVERVSYHVASYLQEQGFRIIPVNPSAVEILGEKCYPDLVAIPERVDVVDVFRRSDDVPPIAEQAVKIGAKALWMQEGVISETAAETARRGGLAVVMDKCMLKEHVKTRSL